MGVMEYGSVEVMLQVGTDEPENEETVRGGQAGRLLFEGVTLRDGQAGRMPCSGGDK